MNQLDASKDANANPDKLDFVKDAAASTSWKIKSSW